jgi:hypothetical protein
MQNFASKKVKFGKLNVIANFLTINTKKSYALHQKR